jgi:DDE superfamily endonuclease
MITTKCKKFKGEIENYLRNGQNNFDVKIDRAFCSLKFKTWLCKSNIIKKDGYAASHILLILFVLPLLRLKTVNSFCNKKWYQWSVAGKDTFYRFKTRAYRWRSLLYKVMQEISHQLQFEQTPIEDTYLIIDDTTIPKRGKLMENVSYIYDHSIGRSILGFCIVSLGLFTGNGYYPLDFSYWVSNRRHQKSPLVNDSDPRSISGQMSHEALHYTKLDLALRMIERAVSQGLQAGYVLFDGWYAWPSFIQAIGKIKKELHVICRLKDSKVLYEYKGKKYQLSALYQKVKKQLCKSKRTGLLLKRLNVTMSGSDKRIIIVFVKGYHEPEESTVKGKKQPKKPKWVAFLSTDTSLQAATVIKKYTKRWACEVFFKESKQLLSLGKDASNSFQSQVCATTISFIRYAVINYLNEKEHHMGVGPLFEELADKTATFTYARRIWQFFKGLFEISFSKIFELFEIEDDFHSFIDTLTHSVSCFAPIQGCET